ncbi:MAG: 16S rRNA (cytidine(1402)-2'-O)-methyltransferase [Marinicella sp.]
MNQTSTTQVGTLYVVATPIGNLKDITLRAIEVLNMCDLVACEDTRHSQRLFQAHDIRTKTKALHQHNENHDSEKIISLILAGAQVALVSDAGTPLISDPGFPLLQLAHKHKIQVVPIPGPSALITLLSVAAINTNPFVFHGFLPAKSKQRLHTFQQWLPLESTHVYYESSHRILDSVQQLVEVFGENTQVAMGRELTKKFEQVFRGKALELLDLLSSNNNHQKGEFVLAIQGSKKDHNDDLLAEHAALAVKLNEHLPPKIAAKIVSEHFNINKKQVYEFILRQEKV